MTTEHLARSGVEWRHNHYDAFTDETISAKAGDGCVHVNANRHPLPDLSPAAARHLADVLNRAADEAELAKWAGGGNHNQEESA